MIQINDLSFYYQVSRPVFKKVSFDIKQGIYGLLGENGVGKTTLLHIISGLLFPKEGSCKVMGYDSYQRNPEMFKYLFFLPEEFKAAKVSVLEMARYNLAFYPDYSEEQLKSYLVEFQVEGDRPVSMLSAGQKKKAMIAYGLSLNTKITLLDEPTNGLDIPSKTQFRRILSSLAGEEKCIVISTHQVRDLINLIDPIIILDRNNVLLNNSIGEITSKLYFTHSLTAPENAIYSEQTLEGIASVCRNTDGRESIANIELLFNAVINNKKLFKEMFNA